ncbi:MAG: DNA-processing protein DprA [Candidatus Ratteibacteria bacterium]|jgi:DNA processing protein
MVDRKTAWVVLNMIEGIGPLRSAALLRYCGSPEAILELGERGAREAGIPQSVAVRLSKWKDLPWQEELECAAQKGISIITQSDPDYPALLKELPDSPPVLYVKGKLLPTLYSIGIVGTRNPSSFGISMASRFAFELARNKVAVISGLARGIDIIAHQSALRARGVTVAVLGSGFNHLYPPEHASTAEKIAESGAVITEFPLSVSPNRGNFPRRNRIVSGLSKGVVIIEAGLRSGALITAGFAADQNREVWVLPTDAGRLRGRGNNLLLRQGACPVEEPSEILEMLGIRAAPSKPSRQKHEEILKKLEEKEMKIYHILQKKPMRFDEIVAASLMNAADIAQIITSLEMKKMIRKNSEGLFSLEKLA